MGSGRDEIIPFVEVGYSCNFVFLLVYGTSHVLHTKLQH